jgi:hypothetical protein
MFLNLKDFYDNIHINIFSILKKSSIIEIDTLADKSHLAIVADQKPN